MSIADVRMTRVVCVSLIAIAGFVGTCMMTGDVIVQAVVGVVILVLLLVMSVVSQRAWRESQRGGSTVVAVLATIAFLGVSAASVWIAAKGCGYMLRGDMLDMEETTEIGELQRAYKQVQSDYRNSLSDMESAMKDYFQKAGSDDSGFEEMSGWKMAMNAKERRKVFEGHIETQRDYIDRLSTRVKDGEKENRYEEWGTEKENIEKEMGGDLRFLRERDIADVIEMYRKDVNSGIEEFVGSKEVKALKVERSYDSFLGRHKFTMTKAEVRKPEKVGDRVSGMIERFGSGVELWIVLGVWIVGLLPFIQLSDTRRRMEGSGGLFNPNDI